MESSADDQRMRHEPFKASEHVDQFYDRLDAYERTAGPETHPLVWLAMRDLGKQISDTRHAVIEVLQSSENLDAKLFGSGDTDPELIRGGMLGILTRKLDEAQQTRGTSENQVKIATNIAWLMRIGGALTVVLTGLLIYFVAHSIWH